MPTKGKSNLYGRGKHGKPNEHISYAYSKMFLSKGFDRHYLKHGLNEMGLTCDQYRSRAISFANKVDRTLHVSFVNEKGLTFKYNLVTNEVVLVTKEGYVTTYYKTHYSEFERWKKDYER